MSDLGFLPWLVGAIVVGGAISAASQKQDVTAPGRELHKKFVSLGNMTGKTRDEIIAVVGQPTSISELAGGKTLLQWQATGCHMAVRFAGNMFDGITHQHLPKQ
jgi:hypothetical protein